MAIAAAGGGAHCDEDGVGVLDRVGCIKREEQTSFVDVVLDEFGQARFEDGHHAILQPVDLARILVHAGDDMAEIGKAGPGHQPHIAGPDHRHAHGEPL